MFEPPSENPCVAQAFQGKEQALRGIARRFSGKDLTTGEAGKRKNENCSDSSPS
jgi:hypothetical protein